MSAPSCTKKHAVAALGVSPPPSVPMLSWTYIVVSVERNSIGLCEIKFIIPKLLPEITVNQVIDLVVCLLCKCVEPDVALTRSL